MRWGVVVLAIFLWGCAAKTPVKPAVSMVVNPADVQVIPIPPCTIEKIDGKERLHCKGFKAKVSKYRAVTPDTDNGVEKHGSKDQGNTADPTAGIETRIPGYRW